MLLINKFFEPFDSAPVLTIRSCFLFMCRPQRTKRSELSAEASLREARRRSPPKPARVERLQGSNPLAPGGQEVGVGVKAPGRPSRSVSCSKVKKSGERPRRNNHVGLEVGVVVIEP